MEAATVAGEDGKPDAAFPSARHERKLQALAAEILRHERVKRERGHIDIEDRALHFRAREITRD